ncbi:MAG: DUF5655 domain-containing protein [Acidimicrobiia bacterium]|nr:DUF5655 domain-containing protein [Acidimicrobiia bacterium]
MESALAEASDHARRLYEATEQAVGACGTFRVHPQKTRVAFINTMTFAGVKLARRWIDVSFITAEPIDDPRIRGLECYGPTSFGHTFRVHEAVQLDSTVRTWLCRSWRRGNQESLDPEAHVEPLAGRALGLAVVPLRTLVVEQSDHLALKIPRYAAEIFADHPNTQARIAKAVVHGVIEAASDHWRFRPVSSDLRQLGLATGDPVDAFLRADI